jgi:2-polyprenyl-3-methyl-5-hydroxy-6-metoxy-1,4-benzoquinol methylase
MSRFLNYKGSPGLWPALTCRPKQIAPESARASSFARDIDQARRFEFGKNWTHFLWLVNNDRVVQAEKSLGTMLEMKTLEGKSFLDIGSGSGLSSLAAARLGARRIHSFDFDPQSVGCTRELKRRYLPECEQWTVAEGSILDPTFVAALGQFDVIYSWGVLHHTGEMWKALEAIIPLVAPEGRLFLAIYNDQGTMSVCWKAIKAFYIKGWLSRAVVVSVFFTYFVTRGVATDLVRLRNPVSRYRDYWKQRGMSVVRDWFDWLGGYPFEVAKPEDIFEFYHKRGFSLIKLRTCAGGLGNNQFVFVNRAL